MMKKYLKPLYFVRESETPIPVDYFELCRSIEREFPGEDGGMVVRALFENGYIETTVRGEWQLTIKGIQERALLPENKYVNFPKSKDKAGDVADETAWQDFRLLCRYFKECVFLSEREQNFLDYKGWNTQWFLPRLPIGWGKEKGKASIRLSFSRNELPAYNFLVASDESSREIFLGYPVSDAWTGNVSQDSPAYVPIFLIPAEILPHAGTGYYDLKLDFSAIRINGAWFEYNLGDLSHHEFFRTLNSIEDENGNIDLDLAITFFNNRFPSKKFHQNEKLSPEALAFDLQNFIRNQRRIRNTAILFQGNDLRYNKSLLRELEIIANCPAEDLDKTALAYVFRNPPLPVEKSGERIALPFVASNPAQASAVEDALTSQISVVTGPPGTGKSQVAVNLIANLVLRGESVLFTSKNHKAIHAIFDKVNSLENSCKLEKDSISLPLVEFCSNPDGSDGVEWRKMKISERKNKAELILKSLENSLSYFPKASEYVRSVEAKITENLSHEKQLRDLRIRFSTLLQEVEDAEKDLLELFTLPPEVAAKKSLDEIRSQKALVKKYSRERKGLFSRFLAWIFRYRTKLERANRKLHELIPEAEHLAGSETSYLERVERVCSLIEKVREGERQKPVFSEEIQRAEESTLGVLKFIAEQWKILCEPNGKVELISSKIKKAWINIQVARVVSISEDEQEAFKSTHKIFSRLEQSGGFRLLSKEDSATALAGFKIFLKAFPAWACTSLSLRKTSPCLPGIFSRTIIDEAAQCDIPTIIPALFRSRGITVVGDPEQFPPVVDFSPRKHEKIWQRHKLDYCYAGNTDGFSFVNRENTAYSIFAERKTAILLNEHFRCQESIADYFNQTYYSGKLIVRTPPANIRLNIQVGRTWKDVRNSLEGELEEVKKYFSDLEKINYQGTIGVISPLKSTVEKLKAELYRFSETLQNFDIQKDVNTVNGFQGGERDVVVLVLGITSALTKGQTWYSESQENRYIYNVAVSRARLALIVIGDKERAFQSGLPELRELAKEPRAPRKKFQSPYEKILYDALRARGLEPIPQYPVAGRYLDLALPDQKIDIEVDGVCYHMNSAGNLNISDIQREMILSANGWRTIRFWSYEIRKDANACVQKILNEMNNAGS